MGRWRLCMNLCLPSPENLAVVGLMDGNVSLSSSNPRNRKSTKLKTQIVKDFEVSREKLGSGSYASVWKGWHRTHPDQLAAVKVISLNKISPGLQDKIDSEIHILKGVHHENIVQLYDVKKCEKYIILILEFCGGGDLSKVIKKHQKPDQTALSEPVALYFMRQLAQGVQVVAAAVDARLMVLLRSAGREGSARQQVAAVVQRAAWFWSEHH